jgi:hypothetical protein
MIPVSKVFANVSQAREAIDRLKDVGFPAERINLVMKSTDEYVPQDVVAVTAKQDETSEAAATGALAGMGLGALVGLALVGTSIVLPGVGLVLIGGPIAAALTGAGLGGASGGLIGALVGAGVPENEASEHVPHITNGGVVVYVMADDDQALMARQVLEEVTTVIV